MTELFGAKKRSPTAYRYSSSFDPPPKARGHNKKSWQPTDEERRTVERMAGFGLPSDIIDQVLGLDPGTVKARCKDELLAGVVLANSKAAEFLYTQFTTPTDLRAGVQAATFWLKCRAGWRENKEPDDNKRGQPSPSDAARQRIAAELDRMAARIGPLNGGEGGDAATPGTGPDTPQSVH